MRTRKVFKAIAACLVVLATVFAMPTPASAAVNTYISVLPQDSPKMVLDVLNGNAATGPRSSCGD